MFHHAITFVAVDMSGSGVYRGNMLNLLNIRI